MDFIKKIDGVQATIADVKKQIQDCTGRIEHAEQRISDVEDDVNKLTSKVSTLESTVKSLADKVDDLECRSRRNNVRLVGLPEKTGCNCIFGEMDTGGSEHGTTRGVGGGAGS